MCIGSRVENANFQGQGALEARFLRRAPAEGLVRLLLPLASLYTPSYQCICRKFFFIVLYYYFSFLFYFYCSTNQGLLSTGIGGGPRAPCRPGLVPHTTP